MASKFTFIDNITRSNIRMGEVVDVSEQVHKFMTANNDPIFPNSVAKPENSIFAMISDAKSL
jgi:hypothetical protein